jgi:hypothetical protein
VLFWENGMLMNRGCAVTFFLGSLIVNPERKVNFGLRVLI